VPLPPAFEAGSCDVLRQMPGGLMAALRVQSSHGAAAGCGRGLRDAADACACARDGGCRCPPAAWCASGSPRRACSTLRRTRSATQPTRSAWQLVGSCCCCRQGGGRRSFLPLTLSPHVPYLPPSPPAQASAS
jgi:hypothetical protein